MRSPRFPEAFQLSHFTRLQSGADDFFRTHTWQNFDDKIHRKIGKSYWLIMNLFFFFTFCRFTFFSLAKKSYWLNNFFLFRKHLGGVGEPIQSYNSKSFRQSITHATAPANNHAEKRKIGALDEDIDVGNVGDENLNIESKLFFLPPYKRYHRL